MAQLKTFIPAMVFCQALSGQGSVEGILSSIAKNNKYLIAFQQQTQVRKLEHRTGMNPDNPKVDYDYLAGSPEEAGNQTDLSITQTLDFPSAYFSKRSISRAAAEKSDLEFNAARQSVLLEAKQLCLKAIYLNKKSAEMLRRYQNARQLSEYFEKKMKTGEATILDANKARYLLLQYKTEYELTNLESKNTLSDLVGLNGGIGVSLPDTVYPAQPVVPSFSRMDSLIETNSLLLRIFDKEKEIAAERIRLSRRMAMPRVEAGYHYQAILGQKYQGAHLGFTIPLWQNRNTVRAGKANLLYSDHARADHRNEHFHENLRLYETYVTLKQTMSDYSTLFASDRTQELLDKSLKAGSLTAIQYIMELSAFYSAHDIYLKAEKEYHTAIANLYKYQL